MLANLIRIGLQVKIIRKLRILNKMIRILN
jgi:hypothetical protein